MFYNSRAATTAKAAVNLPGRTMIGSAADDDEAAAAGAIAEEADEMALVYVISYSINDM